MKKMFNEGNQIHNFMSSSCPGTVINYGSGSGSDFLTSYGSGYGSVSTGKKVTVPTVPVPVPVPQHCIQHFKTGTFTKKILLLRVIFALLDPDPDPLTRLNPDPIRIRIRNPVSREAKFTNKKEKNAEMFWCLSPEGWKLQ